MRQQEERPHAARHFASFHVALQRAHRCTEDDFKELSLAYVAFQKRIEAQYSGTASSSAHALPNNLLPGKSKRKFLDLSPTGTPSTMLYYLITFSELWQLPMPDLETLTEHYANGPFSLDVETLPAYCLLSGGFNNDSEVATCNQLREVLEKVDDRLSELPAVEEPFLYEHDQYWNTTATLDDDVGVLLIVGGLDFQTPSELGKREYDALRAPNKMLVEFDFGGHGAGFLPTSSDDVSQCGPSILASFITHDGDVTKVNTSCLEALPALTLDDQAFQDLILEVQLYLDQHSEMQEPSTGSDMDSI